MLLAWIITQQGILITAIITVHNAITFPFAGDTEVRAVARKHIIRHTCSQQEMLLCISRHNRLEQV